MSGFLTHWFTITVALGITSWILPGVVVTSIPALLIGGIALGFVNAVVRPILVFLSLPITVLTLGLFYLVVNGIAFGLAAWVVPGFAVRSLGSAILGALVMSVASWFVGQFTGAGDGSSRSES